MKRQALMRTEQELGLCVRSGGNQKQHAGHTCSVWLKHCAEQRVGNEHMQYYHFLGWVEYTVDKLIVSVGSKLAFDSLSVLSLALTFWRRAAICFLKFRWLSITRPRYLAWELAGVATPSTCKGRAKGARWCPDVQELALCGIQGQNLSLEVLIE